MHTPVILFTFFASHSLDAFVAWLYSEMYQVKTCNSLWIPSNPVCLCFSRKSYRFVIINLGFCNSFKRKRQNENNETEKRTCLTPLWQIYTLLIEHAFYYDFGDYLKLNLVRMSVQLNYSYDFFKSVSTCLHLYNNYLITTSLGCQLFYAEFFLRIQKTFRFLYHPYFSHIPN